MSKKLYINCVELQRDIRTNLIEQYKGKSLGETMFALEKKVKQNTAWINIPIKNPQPRK